MGGAGIGCRLDVPATVQDLLPHPGNVLAVQKDNVTSFKYGFHLNRQVRGCVASSPGQP